MSSLRGGGGGGGGGVEGEEGEADSFAARYAPQPGGSRVAAAALREAVWVFVFVLVFCLR